MEREIERNKVFCVSFVSRGWVKEREREGENAFRNYCIKRVIHRDVTTYV